MYIFGQFRLNHKYTYTCWLSADRIRVIHFIESSVNSENHTSNFLHLTPVVAKILLTDTLEFESTSFPCGPDMISAPFFSPLEGEILMISEI